MNSPAENRRSALRYRHRHRGGGHPSRLRRLADLEGAWCAYCLMPFLEDLSDATADHAIVSYAESRSYDLDVLVLACAYCNNMRVVPSEDEWTAERIMFCYLTQLLALSRSNQAFRRGGHGAERIALRWLTSWGMAEPMTIPRLRGYPAWEITSAGACIVGQLRDASEPVPAFRKLMRSGPHLSAALAARAVTAATDQDEVRHRRCACGYPAMSQQSMNDHLLLSPVSSDRDHYQVK